MHRKTVFLGGIVAALLLTVTALPASAARSAVTKEPLTVKITDTGTVWGTVTLSPAQTGGKCKKSSCSYKVAKGTKLTFSEKATDSSTWPFCHWRVNGKVAGTGTSVKLTMPGKAASVSAVYVLPGECTSKA